VNATLPVCCFAVKATIAASRLVASHLAHSDVDSVQIDFVMKDSEKKGATVTLRRYAMNVVII